MARRRCCASPSAADALRLCHYNHPDLLLLDLNLPDASGLEVLREIRGTDGATGGYDPELPVIVISGRGAEADRIRGLECGADDYVVKPFSPNELIARVRAVIRRTQKEPEDGLLRYADLEMDLVAHRAYRAGKAVHLGPTEFRLLRHFLQNPRRVFSREQLLDLVWGHDAELELRTVDVHIRRLRRALNADGGSDLLRTVRSVGYALDSAEG